MTKSTLVGRMWLFWIFDEVMLLCVRWDFLTLHSPVILYDITLENGIRLYEIRIQSKLFSPIAFSFTKSKAPF